MTTRQVVVNPPQPKLNFHVDKARDILWIIHRKVAGSSLRKALNIQKMVTPGYAVPYNKDMRTITVVRHPWDRITSGMFNPYSGPPGSFEQRIHEEILNREGPHAIDWHLWPQSYAAEGFRIDDIILFEKLAEGWDLLRQEYHLPPLGWVNRGEQHDWRNPDGPFDWSPLMPWYSDDFRYCEEWERE